MPSKDKQSTAFLKTTVQQAYHLDSWMSTKLLCPNMGRHYGQFLPPIKPKQNIWESEEAPTQSKPSKPLPKQPNPTHLST